MLMHIVIHSARIEGIAMVTAESAISQHQKYMPSPCI